MTAPALDQPAPIHQLIAARHVADLDLRRALAAMRQRGEAYDGLMRQAGLTEHDLDQAPEVGPYELAERYAAGQLSEADLIAQLATWNYADDIGGDGWDDVMVSPPGSWYDVERAVEDDLITSEVYENIRAAKRHSRSKKNVHTVPSDGGWANRREGAERASGTYSTKAEAQAAGREQAKKDGVEHIIHNKDGRITT